MLTSRILMSAAMSVFVGGNASPALSQQDIYAQMQSVFNVCVDNARTGTEMTVEQIVAQTGVVVVGSLQDKPDSYALGIQLEDDYACAVWAEAGQYNAHAFRKAVEAYILSFDVDGSPNACVWRSVFPSNVCALNALRVTHADGAQYTFRISFEIVAHEYVAIVIQPTLIFVPDGYVRVPSN